LNREWAGKSYEKYEILNFALPNFQPPQQLVMFEKALTFKPQAVFYVAAGYEMSRAQRYLIEVVQKGITIPYAPLRAIMQKAGIEAQTEETEAHRRLRPFQGEILAWIYQHIVEECRARGIRPVWAFVPQVRKGVWEEETPEVLQIAKTAGFITVNLADVFKNQDLTLIRLAEWDEHPNTRGHQLIADQLYAALQAKQDIIFSPPVTAEKKPIHR
jgi:alginate O-acetyltransferase complex protein AlgI